MRNGSLSAFVLFVGIASVVETPARAAAPGDPATDPLAPVPIAQGAFLDGPKRDWATDDSETEQILGGHLFIFPSLQKSAFMTTNIAFTQALELLNVPNVPVRPGRTYDVNAFGVDESIDLGVRFLKRFEVSLGGAAEAYAGSGIKSALAGGAAYRFKGELGLGMRLLRSSHTQLAFRLGGELGSAKRVDFIPVITSLATETAPATVDAVVDGNIGKQIVTPARRVAVTGSFNVAQSLSRAFGLQGAVVFTESFVHLDLFQQQNERVFDITLTTPELDAAVTFDLRPLVPPVPIAFIAEYSVRWTHVGTQEPGYSKWLSAESMFGLGAYYSGRKDLQVGLQYLGILRFETTQGFDAAGRPFPIGNPNYNALQLTLRYTW